MSKHLAQSKFSRSSAPRLLGTAAVTTTVLLASLLASASPARAATPTVDLGSAASYSVLGASTVTNTGGTVLGGDLGLTPGSSITGFPPGEVRGQTHISDAPAQAAHNDLQRAYRDAASRPSTRVVAGDIGGQTLVAGVYNSGSSVHISGVLTLDGQNNSDAVFIFQMGSTLITSGSSVVKLINGAKASNVFWAVGSSSTLGANSAMVGTIMALASDTVGAGVSVLGRVMAITAAVTLDNATFTVPVMASSSAVATCRS